MDRILISLKKENGPRASSAPALGLNTIIFKHVYWYMQQTQVSVYRTIGPLVIVLTALGDQIFLRRSIYTILLFCIKSLKFWHLMFVISNHWTICVNSHTKPPGFEYKLSFALVFQCYY